LRRARAGEITRILDREVVQRTHTSWLEYPEIRLYTLRQIDPVNAEWPVDWFTIWLKGRRFGRAVTSTTGMSGDAHTTQSSFINPFTM
jgi:hypothetical protein